MVNFRTCCLALLLLHFSCAEKKHREIISIHYPGDSPATDIAQIFAPGIISTDSFEHSAPCFSPDGKIVLWSTVEMPSWQARIWEMKYEDGKWSSPYHPSFSDTTASDLYPSFSPDGQVLYFSSSRKLPSGQLPGKGNVLWRVRKAKSGWAVPHPLDSTVSNGGEFAPSIASNGNLYFTYGPFKTPDWNIIQAKDINDSNPALSELRFGINTTHYEDGPYVAPDESYLIFESDRPEGLAGGIDLYIAFKSGNGDWSVPLNMGPKINTAAAERFARVSPDGEFFFFGSNRRQISGKANFDIYWIKSTVIAELRNRVIAVDKDGRISE